MTAPPKKADLEKRETARIVLFGKMICSELGVFLQNLRNYCAELVQIAKVYVLVLKLNAKQAPDCPANN